MRYERECFKNNEKMQKKLEVMEGGTFFEFRYVSCFTRGGDGFLKVTMQATLKVAVLPNTE